MTKKETIKFRKIKLKTLPDGFGSVTDLARRLGVSKSRISQLHRRGALGDAISKVNGRRYLINIELAVENLRKHSDPETRGIGNKISTASPDPSPDQTTDDRGQKTEDRGQTRDGGEQRKETAKTIELAGMSFSSARTLKERYNAEMKKLDYEERSGTLLRDEDVRKGAFEMYRKTRDSLLNIIDRISAQLAAEKKEANVRIILENEIRNALTHIRSEFHD
jgi:hypothetical protein